LGEPTFAPPREPTRSPIHRQRLGGRPAAERFFYARPVLALPAFDRLVIALHGAGFGFLRAPVQTMHQPTDMIAMVMHAELAPDHFRDTGRGPQLRPVAVRRGSLQQQPQQAAPLTPAQFQWASRRAAYAQGVGAPAAARSQPAHDRTRCT